MSEAGHVLVIGVDGVRFDYLGPDAAPAIWALGQAGFLAGHGVTGNDLTGHRLAEQPDFVTRATRAGLPTLLAVSGWPPLALAATGGPASQG